VCAFFGCLYGGAVVVPAFPFVNQPTPPGSVPVAPRRGEHVLTSRILDVVQRDPEALDDAGGDVRWIAADDLLDGIEDDWEWPSVGAESVAQQTGWCASAAGTRC
jgi:acyl-CoA synthetase (AMP-forming)/AMP-acid ligase II